MENYIFDGIYLQTGVYPNYEKIKLVYSTIIPQIGSEVNIGSMIYLVKNVQYNYGKYENKKDSYLKEIIINLQDDIL